MKIAMIWYWERATEIYPNWRDGLRASFEEIEKEGHTVNWFLDKNVPRSDDYDAILFWDDSNSQFFSYLHAYPSAKKGIFLSSDNNLNLENLKKLDVVFCESKPVLEKVVAGGVNGVLAFGTDTNFFKPDKTVKKDIECFYPATFSPWKRQSEIAYLGNKLLCVGTCQPDGVDELAECRKMGVKVIEGYIPASEILNYYQRANFVIIPAVHGSERTVLEAMACDIEPVITHSENVKTYSYLKEFKKSGLNPREFVLKNYSEVIYSSKILENIL